MTNPDSAQTSAPTLPCRDCGRGDGPVCWGLCEGCWGKRDRAAQDLRDQIDLIECTGQDTERLPALEHQLWEMHIGR